MAYSLLAAAFFAGGCISAAVAAFFIYRALRRRLEKIMATLDQILADVTDEETSLDSISTLIAGLQKQIADALSGATLPPAVQAKVDAIFAAAETNKAKIAAALAANVPPAPAAPTGPTS